MEPSTITVAKTLIPLLDKANDTFVFSPLSLVHALAILCTLGKGESIEELKYVLNLANYDPTKVNQDNFQLAANVFLKQMKLTPKAKAEVEKLFKCFPENLISAEYVNSWASKHTNGEITYIVDDVSKDDALLLSALYFSQQFLHKFEESATRSMTFHAPSGDKEMPMMNARRKMPYAETQQAMIVDLQYERPGVVARILLPKKGVAMLDALTAENLKIRTTAEDVVFTMPKITVESQFELTQALKKSGCKYMFSAVDCSESLQFPMYVSGVVQKALIRVDEKGTTAAAVTAVRMMRCAMVSPPRIFQVICDRPFWFVLLTEYEVLFVVYYNG